MIKEFNSQNDYNRFIYSITKNNSIGFGGEGECFLGKDNLAYKVINSDSLLNYDVDSIITKDKYNLSHFAFPIDLYTDSNHEKLYGYSSEYFRNDKFKEVEEEDIDFYLECLISSYYKMLDEVKILSKDKIFLFDIINNIIYCNYEIVAIDTLCYFKKKESTYKANKDMLLNAIENEFYFYFDLDKTFQDEKSIEQIARNVKKYVKKIKY